MARFPFRLVTVDIDGTLTLGHGWGFLARQVGRLPAFESTNRRFIGGRISEDQHLGNLLRLAGGLPLSRIHEILEATPKLTGIEETVDGLREEGARVALLMHNPRYVCDWYRGRFGFDDAEGSNWGFDPDGRVARTGRVRADKRTGLARLLERQGVEAREVAHVGDGRADAAIFARVGAGVALNSSLPEVERAADVALHLTDLRPLLPALRGLTPRGR